MKRMIAAIAAALTILVCMAPATSARVVRPRAPFITSTPPMIVALQPGVDILPILTAGDVIGGRVSGFQYTGVPDGIGVYQSGPDNLEVYTNHELSYRYGDPAWSRVSHLTLNSGAEVTAASYVVDGTERYEYFCSSTLDVLDGVPWYLTGEEWFASPKGGMSVAINVLTGRLRETPAVRRPQP